MLLLLTTSSFMAMENSPELKETLQLEKEKLEYKNKKLALMNRAAKVKELKILLQNRHCMKFDLPEQWHTWDAFMKISIRSIFDTHIEEFSPEQKKEMEKLVALSKKTEEDHKNFCEEQEAL